MRLEKTAEQEQKNFEASLRRAFVNRKADYLIVEAYTLKREYIRECIRYGLNNGFLYRGKDITEEDVLDLDPAQDQYLAYTYSLSSKGKKHFGLEDKC